MTPRAKKKKRGQRRKVTVEVRATSVAKEPGLTPHNNFFIKVFGVVDNLTHLLKAALGQYADLFDFSGLSSEMGTTITVGGREVRSDITAFVRLKESRERAGIFLLVEHKAQKNPSPLLVQLLGYMASMLNKQQHERGAGRPLDPVLAVVVYNGQVKVYKGPKELRELYSTEKVFKEMGVPILNFGYVLLNVHDTGGEKLNTVDESSFLELVFFAMRKIFDLKGKGQDEILKELFSKGEKLPDKVWEKLMQEIGEYIMNVHPDISVKILSEAEEKGRTFHKEEKEESDANVKDIR